MTLRAFLVLATALSLCASTAAAGDKAAARRLYEQAHEHYLAGRFRESLRAANDAVGNDSRLGVAFALRARVWSVFGDPAHAREDATRALDLIGSGRLDPEALQAQSAAYLALGRADKALESADAAVASSHQAPQALAARARVFVAMEDAKKALADYDAALKPGPVPLWLYARARLYYELDEDKKAVADLTAALRQNKGMAIAYGLIGAALARQGDLPRAMKAYVRANELDGEYVFAYLGRAAIRLHNNEEAAALKEFENAVHADAQDYAPYFNRGEAHWRAGRRDQALADYRNAMAAPKLAPEAAVAVGDRYMSLLLWRDAADAYTRAYQLDRAGESTQRAKPAAPPADSAGGAFGSAAKPAVPQDEAARRILGRGRPSVALLRRAKAWEALKETKNALADFDEAMKLQPNSARIAAGRGSLEMRMGLDKEALADLTRAVRMDPRDAEVLVARASFYARAEKAQLALQDYDAAIEADPTSAEAYNGRGALRANAFADLEKALLDVLKAVDLSPRDPGFRFNLGMLRLKNRMYLKAIEAFDSSLELKGPAARILERRAEAKFQLGDHVGSKLDIASALEKDPRNPSLYDTLGYIRLRAREYEQAVRDLSQALRLDDGLASAYLHRGRAYGALGQTRGALADLRRASELDRRSKETWTDLCQLRRLMKQPRDAAEDCDRALSLDSQYGPAYFQRALAMLAMRDYARAVEDVDTAWQLGVRRAEGQIAKAVAHAASRQYKEAHRSFLKAVGLDPYARSSYVGFAPGHPDGDDFLSSIVDLESRFQADMKDPYVFVLRADSLYSAEHFDKAVLEYTKAMELDGTLADAYVGRGTALTAQDALEASQQDLIRAIELAPDDADARVRLAVTLTMRRNYSAAIVELGKALQLDPKNSEALLRAGNVHYFKKDYAKARDSYVSAVKADPLDPNAVNGLGLGDFALRRYDDSLEDFSRAISLNPLSDRFYRNRAAVWTARQKYGNAAGDFHTAGMVNTDPSLIEEYRRLVEEAQARAATKSS